jgi:hypothetical protein
MQHYGLPTRLLDWTRSPLIAAYFALWKYKHKGVEPADAAIWMLDPCRLNEIFHDTCLYFPMDSNTVQEMIKPAFKEGYKYDGDVFAAMAVEHDVRMFVQQGAFTIHPKIEPLNEREGHSRYLVPLLIPGSSVTEMAFEIQACGFIRGDLFPDLTNLALELTGDK